MKRNIKRIQPILEQRPDICKIEVAGLAEDPYLHAVFNGKQRRKHSLIIHPYKTESGPILRICYLDFGVVPDDLEAEPFCALLNQRSWLGRFTILDEQKRLVSFVSHHFLSSLCPPADILNRLIDQALAAFEFYEVAAEQVLRQIAAHSRLELILASSNSKPGLN